MNKFVLLVVLAYLCVCSKVLEGEDLAITIYNNGQAMIKIRVKYNLTRAYRRYILQTSLPQFKHRQSCSHPTIKPAILPYTNKTLRITWLPSTAS
jgi:hypothetical protein